MNKFKNLGNGEVNSSMTLAEFRKRTAIISDEQAKNCDLRLMAQNNIFLTPTITEVRGDANCVYIVCKALDDYLDKNDMS